MMKLRRKNEFLETLLNIYDIHYEVKNNMMNKIIGGDDETQEIEQFKLKIQKILNEYNDSVKSKTSTDMTPNMILKEMVPNIITMLFDNYGKYNESEKNNKLIEEMINKINIFTQKWSNINIGDNTKATSTATATATNKTNFECESGDIEKPDVHVKIESKMETYV